MWGNADRDGKSPEIGGRGFESRPGTAKSRPTRSPKASGGAASCFGAIVSDMDVALLHWLRDRMSEGYSSNELWTLLNEHLGGDRPETWAAWQQFMATPLGR